MSKRSYYREICVGSFVIGITMLFIGLFHAFPGIAPLDTSVELPPPVDMSLVRVYTPSEATVEVSAYFDDQRSYGRGIVIQHNGRMFVLTSSMIFNKDVEYITVPWREWDFPAKVIHRNDILGLVALDCGLPLNTPHIDLNGGNRALKEFCDQTISVWTDAPINPWRWNGEYDE